MFRCNPRSTLLVLCLYLLVPATSHGQQPKASATARLLMKTFDAVIEHHIEPPTRQQMVVDAVRHIADGEQKLPPTGLSERISAAVPGKLESLLAQELAAYIEEGDSPAENVDLPVAIGRYLESHGVRVESQSEYRVQEQLAGNRYVGIGVTAGIHQSTKQLEFMTVIPGGAAAAAGVQNGDVVVTVDGKPTRGESITKVIQWLRGEEGTKVTVTVRQPNDEEVREYTLTRAIVPLETVKEPAYSHDKRVVAIGFERFSGSTVNELRKIADQLPDTVEVVTLDFRSLFGTNLHHGILIGNALLDEKLIGQVETSDGIRKVTAEPGALFGDRKLVLMVNGGTQGTAHWVAAAVNDAVKEGVVLGHSDADGLVYEGVPLKGDDLVIEMPTARLRRADGSLLASRKPRVGDSMQGVTVVRAPGVLGRLFRQETLGDIEIEPLLQQGGLKVIAEVIASWHEQRKPILEKSKE